MGAVLRLGCVCVFKSENGSSTHSCNTLHKVCFMCLEADVIKSIIYLDCITQISAFVSQQSHILEESVALVFLITSCKRIIVAVTRVAVKVHQGKHLNSEKSSTLSRRFVRPQGGSISL